MAEPEYEVEEVKGIGGVVRVMYVCAHANKEPVLDVAGEHVATLCRDCDAQLPGPPRAAWPRC